MTDIEDKNLNIPDQLYVGIQGGKSFSDIMFPLGFATQVGTDQAYQNRKNTVDNWVQPNRVTYEYQYDEQGNHMRDERGQYLRTQVVHEAYEGTIIDNTPLEGFTFEKSVTRWRTQNKWFSINDPRGFQLQISAENLGDLLINCGIENGNLKGQFVWAKDRNNIFLCRVTHPSFIAKSAPKVPQGALDPGDTVSIGSEGSNEVYLGSAYSIRAGNVTRFVSPTGEKMGLDFYPSYRYYNYYDRQREPQYTTEEVGVHTKDTQKVHIFRSGEEGNYSYRLLRSKPKKYRIVTKAESPPELPTGYVSVSCSFPGRWGKFFVSKADMLADTVTLEEWYAQKRAQDEAWAIKYGNNSYRREVVEHMGDVDDLNMRSAYW